MMIEIDTTEWWELSYELAIEEYDRDHHSETRWVPSPKLVYTNSLEVDLDIAKLRSESEDRLRKIVVKHCKEIKP